MKKVFKILTLIMLIITILKIGDTYSKYFTRANTDTLSQDVADWVIKINGVDAVTGGDFEIPIGSFENVTNPYAVTDKISPSSQGYVDFKIDPTGTEVAVRYDIEILLTGDVTEYGIQARLEMTSGEQLIRTAENTYSGTISLADVLQGKQTSIRCYIEWPNNELNNEKDSELGSMLGANLSLDVSLTASQYTGEEIVPYVAPAI